MCVPLLIVRYESVELYGMNFKALIVFVSLLRKNM